MLLSILVTSDYVITEIFGDKETISILYTNPVQHMILISIHNLVFRENLFTIEILIFSEAFVMIFVSSREIFQFSSER